MSLCVCVAVDVWVAVWVVLGGGLIFEREKIGHLPCFAKIFIGPQIQNFNLKCCILTWRRASDNFDCFPKIRKKKKVYQRARGNIFFDCLKAKKGEHREKFYLSFFQVKNKFALQKCIHILYFKFFLAAIVLWSKKNVVANFQQQQKVGWANVL